MATVVTMPRLSDTMTEGTVATWLKKVGDTIKEGDILAEIETDKATMEFESFNAGVLLHIGIQEGQSAPVDSLLAIIGQAGEDISALLNQGTAAPASNVTADAPAATPTFTSAPAATAPTGIQVITMPRLSDTMTTGTVATWLKKVGDTVKEGDILAEIETDKATMEFESFHSGTLLYIGIQEGESAPVDSVLAIIGPAGTDVLAYAESLKSGGVPAATPASAPAETPTSVSATTPVAAPVVQEGGRIFASPLARQIAKEKGIDLGQVKGTGENGRIVKSDVEHFTVAPVATASAPVGAATAGASEVKPFVPAGSEFAEQIKNSQMRKTIARRLSESIFTAPHFYLTIEVAMDEAMKSRGVINSVPDTKVSFNDMVIKACAMALKKHPKVNSQWSDEAITINHHVHIGVAVAVEDGLVVPVVRFTDQMTLSQIGNAVKDLAGKARNKKLQPSEMEGSTFTVSNLGMFGITEFTSIINQPNSAILSVGAIIQKPVVRDGQIVVGHTMKVTLACDHRTVDGATGAEFLQTLRTFLENPVTMLA
ncbi:pyruvate dehydrogenase complex dihydrolipoamide acetyltransferase [Flavobacterium sp.]|uniref:pyruvate dehydrogenase complex dihydrolipoamide acetyltransferase n=1 Tax=Flavobacterium sp. TaxID=239 RepID=UPI002616C1E0|nr:pyruvate dehydrogenase complex dihydrolipoamide acetyltransferase [Flavobacterium sp.]